MPVVSYVCSRSLTRSTFEGRTNIIYNVVHLYTSICCTLVGWNDLQKTRSRNPLCSISLPTGSPSNCVLFGVLRRSADRRVNREQGGETAVVSIIFQFNDHTPAWLLQRYTGSERAEKHTFSLSLSLASQSMSTHRWSTAGHAVPQRSVTDAPTLPPRRTVALSKGQQYRIRQLHHRITTKSRSPSRQLGSAGISPGAASREKARTGWKHGMKEVSLMV